METGDLVIVRVPQGYANRLLQNSIGRLLSINKTLNVATVELITGNESGRLWQFCLHHIKRANPNPRRVSLPGMDATSGG